MLYHTCSNHPRFRQFRGGIEVILNSTGVVNPKRVALALWKLPLWSWKNSWMKVTAGTPCGRAWLFWWMRWDVNVTMSLERKNPRFFERFVSPYMKGEIYRTSPMVWGWPCWPSTTLKMPCRLQGLPPRKLTNDWLEKPPWMSRCISYWKRGIFQPVMLVWCRFRNSRKLPTFCCLMFNTFSPVSENTAVCPKS